MQVRRAQGESAAREDSPDSVSTIAQDEDNNPIKKLEKPSA